MLNFTQLIFTQDINQAQRDVDQITADYVEAKAKVEEEGLRYKLVEKLDSSLKENENETKVIRIKKQTAKTDEN